MTDPPHEDVPPDRPALRVAHVVLSLDDGGLERVVLALARGAAGDGQDPAVLCLRDPGALAPEARGLRVPLVSLGAGPGVRLRTLALVARALRFLRPEVVHTHQVGALICAGPAARRAGVRAVVHTEHGNHVARQRGLGGRVRGRALWKVAAWSASRFFCVSEEVAREAAAFGAVPRRKLFVVPNGIDAGAFGRAGGGEARRALGIPEGAPVVGTLGRLTEVKRQDLLISGFARVAAGRPDARLLVVGDGPLRGALEAEADRLGLAGRVHFAGGQPRPQPYLAAMDVFALTSRSEGMPLAVLEAWATGLPVVASDAGGLPSLVDEGRTGLLFPTGDADALAGRLSRLLADRELAAALGAAGRDEVVARYDARRMVGEYGRHYRDVLAARGGRARGGSCASFS